ncbi:MAG: hypothetical protein ACREA9_23255 [Pyrinomonadaceae bacterium]
MKELISNITLACAFAAAFANRPTASLPDIRGTSPAAAVMPVAAVSMTPASAVAEHEAVSTAAALSYTELAELTAQLDEARATIAALRLQVAQLTPVAPAAEPKFTQPDFVEPPPGLKPKPVVATQPVYYQSFSSCGPNGCGRQGIFRGRVFGRRR